MGGALDCERAPQPLLKPPRPLDGDSPMPQEHLTSVPELEPLVDELGKLLQRRLDLLDTRIAKRHGELLQILQDNLEVCSKCSSAERGPEEDPDVAAAVMAATEVGGAAEEEDPRLSSTSTLISGTAAGAGNRLRFAAVAPPAAQVADAVPLPEHGQPTKAETSPWLQRRGRQNSPRGLGGASELKSESKAFDATELAAVKERYQECVPDKQIPVARRPCAGKMDATSLSTIDEAAHHDFSASERIKKRRSERKSKEAAARFARLAPEVKSESSVGSGSIFSKAPSLLLRLVRSPKFEFLSCLLIIANLVFMGVEAQVSISEPTVPPYMQTSENFFTFCFTVELLLNIIGRGPSRYYCGEDRVWAVIDTFLVLVALVEAFLLLLAGVSDLNLAYCRSIRFFRTVRIFRAVRLLKVFRPMRVLVQSICVTLKSLVWTVLLLSAVVYTFGVLFTMAVAQALHDEAEAEQLGSAKIGEVKEFFGSLSQTTLSLVKSVTGGIDWTVCTEALNHLGGFWVALFITFIVFSQLALLNVVTGVVCHAAIESVQQDQEMVVQSQLAIKEVYVQQLQEIFHSMDLDSSGFLTVEEFEEHLTDAELRDYFESLDLTVEEAWSLFKLLDTEGNGILQLDDFVMGILRLRGTARSVDVHMLMYESKWVMSKLGQVLKHLDALHHEVYGARMKESLRRMNASTNF